LPLRSSSRGSRRSSRVPAPARSCGRRLSTTSRWRLPSGALRSARSTLPPRDADVHVGHHRMPKGVLLSHRNLLHAAGRSPPRMR
jgi:hypothetical protein